MTFHKFRYWLLLFLFVGLISSCDENINPSKKKVESNSISIFYDTSSITIIKFQKSFYWLFDSTYRPSDLTQNDILEIENLFQKSVADYNFKIKEKIKKYDFIDLNKWKYKRQYVCVLNKRGQKEVYINCFCSTSGDDWKKALLEVDDGGNCYFSFKLNLSTKKYYNFLVNGFG